MEQAADLLSYSCRSLRELTPLSELTSLDRATFGAKFTSGCTWLFSPMHSTRSHSKSSHTARMISSMRVRCASLKTLCRYFVTKTKWAWRTKVQFCQYGCSDTQP